MSDIQIIKKHNLNQDEILILINNCIIKLKENFEFDKIIIDGDHNLYKVNVINKHVEGEFIDKDNEIIININLLSFTAKIFKKNIEEKIEELLLEEFDTNKKD